MAVYSDMGNAQFENVNSLRSYPFVECADLKDVTGRMLPRDLIVDAHVVVPASCHLRGADGQEKWSAPTVYLSSAYVSPHMVSVCFKSTYGETAIALSVTVRTEDLRPYMPYAMRKLTASHDAGGVVTFGDFEIPGSPQTYRFSSAAILPCCVIAKEPARLRSIVDARSGERIKGDARIYFSGHIGATKSKGEVSLSLEDGSAADLASKCTYSSVLNACGADPITSINGVRPDSDGNIVIWFH